MLTAIRRLRFGILMAGLAGTVMLAGAAPAMAAKLVTSDVVTWHGSYSPASGIISVSSCKVKSDTELTAFPCQLNARVSSLPPSPTIGVGSEWLSSDGVGVFGFTVTLVVSKPPVYTYAATGPCEEREETEPPSGVFISYPCVVSVKLTFNTVKSTVSGSYSVKEESTQP